MPPFLVFLILVVPFILAVRAYLVSSSWKQALKVFFLIVLGIELPLFVFFLSVVLVPDWKGAIKVGWLDCFHMGKLFLTPLVLWASAAFFALEVRQVKKRLQPWIVLGYLSGAIVSALCFIVGILVHVAPNFLEFSKSSWILIPFLLVPLATSLWFSMRSMRLLDEAKVARKSVIITLLLFLLLLSASIVSSRVTCQRLPEQGPDCFIVSAAMRGHSEIVGERVTVLHEGRLRQANQQLQVFWKFEAKWREESPQSYRHFRYFYNRAGPQIAALISSPLVADVVYLLLVPFEAVASFSLKLFEDSTAADD